MNNQIGVFFYTNRGWLSSLQLKGEATLQSSYQRQKKRIINSLPNRNNIKDRIQLEKTLENMIYKKSNSFITGRAQQLFEKNVKNIVTALTNYNYDNLSSEIYKMEIRKTRSEVPEVNKLINQLYNILNHSISTGKMTDSDYLEYNKIISNFKNYVKSHMIEENQVDMTEYFNTLDANKLNELLQMASVSRAEAQGDIFEVILAAASVQLSNAKKKGTKQILKQIKGKESSSIKIDTNNLTKELQETLFEGKTYEIDEYNRIKLNPPTQDKLDVVFEWGGQNLQVSAKSYKNIKQIKIADNFPLWQYILNDDGYFINHWLSLLASSGMKSELLEYQQLMKYSLLVKSLVGTMKSSGQSDTFIVQDKQTKKIYIRTMRQLLEPIQDHLDNIDSIISYGSSYPKHITANSINEAFAELRSIKLRAELNFDKLIKLVDKV